jgi:flavin reductase (DIM6/NTAB) family NADH-FMN oxidoreductase RutF
MAVTSDIVAAGLGAPPVLVTTAADGDQAGSVVPFHTQCSVEPVHYAVWLPTDSHTYALSRHGSHIAVHVVGSSTALVEFLRTITGDVPAELFDRFEWRAGPGGVPLLTCCGSSLVLEVVSSGWDHGGYACVLGSLVEADLRGARVQPAPMGQGLTRGDRRPDSLDGRHAGGHSIVPMDAETRRRFINAAIGAGHDIDLPNPAEHP